MKWEGFTGKFDNLDRDIFFHGLIKDAKGRPELDDVAKCKVWEENRTKYHTIKNYRTIIDFSKSVRKMFDDIMSRASSPEEKQNVVELWNKFRDEYLFNTFDHEGLTRIFHYWGNFPIKDGYGQIKMFIHGSMTELSVIGCSFNQAMITHVSTTTV